MKPLRMDPQSVRAAEVFGVDLDKVTEAQREIATLNRNKLWAFIYTALYLENYYGQK